MSLSTALRCFEENWRLPNVQADHEKNNLYNGLAGLTEGVIQMQGGIKILLCHVEEVERLLRERK